LHEPMMYTTTLHYTTLHYTTPSIDRLVRMMIIWFMSNRSTAHINISRASCIPISLLPTMHVQTGKSKWEIATDLSIITMMCLSYCLQFFLLTRARIRASVCMYRRERKNKIHAPSLGRSFLHILLEEGSTGVTFSPSPPLLEPLACYYRLRKCIMSVMRRKWMAGAPEKKE